MCILKLKRHQARIRFLVKWRHVQSWREGPYQWAFDGRCEHLRGCVCGFPGGTGGKEHTCQRRRHKRCSFDPCQQDPLEEDHPLQYCCLENPMDGGVWWATVCRVTTRWMWLSDLACMWALGSGYWLLSSCYRDMWIGPRAHGNFCCEGHAKMSCYHSSSSWGVFPDERQLSEGTHNFLKYLLLIHFAQTDSYNLLSYFMTQSNSSPWEPCEEELWTPLPFQRHGAR